MSNNDFISSPNAFVFACIKCRESFTVHFDELVKDGTILCPNCKQKMSNEISEKLHLAASHINDAIDALSSSSCESSIFAPDPEVDCGFRFKIRWDKMQPDHINQNQGA